MAKGFIRLGILLTLLFIAHTAIAALTGEPRTSGRNTGFVAASSPLGDSLNRHQPNSESIDIRGLPIGDGTLQRIETDLLILPKHLLTLANCRGNEISAGRFRASLYSMRSSRLESIIDNRHNGAGRHE